MNIEKLIKNEEHLNAYQKYSKKNEAFDLAAFCKEIGVSLKETEDLPSGVFLASGMISEKPTICINSLNNPTVKRFLIAHGLGHFFMHFESFKKGIIDTQDKKKINKEREKAEEEANLFALNMLIPSNHFNKMLENENSSIHLLADHFYVSESIVFKKMRLLGLAKENISYFC